MVLYSGVYTQCSRRHCNNKCAAASHPPFPLPLAFLLAFIAEEMSHGMEYPFGEVGLAGLAMFPPKTLPTTSLTVRGECWRDSAWCFGSQNFSVFINTFIATNTNHRTMRAALGKNIISARPNSHYSTLLRAVELPKDVGDAPEIN